LHLRQPARLLASWIALSGCAAALAAGGELPAERPHEPLRLVRIPLPEASAGLARDLGLDLLGRESGVVEAAVSDRELDHLSHLGLEVSVVEGDLEAAQRRRLGPAADRYHTFGEVEAELQDLHRQYPEIVGEPIVIGRSWEQRPIWAIKISDHPALDEREPAVLYDALHHAREPMGMESLLYAMHELASRYAFDPEIQQLVDTRELWFVPVVNPDGYVFGGIGGMWRKNRRPNADGSFGVDLNRNYSYRWGVDDVGSSPQPSSPTYRGPGAFSEPESRAMRDFSRTRQFAAGMTLHAFADINLLPTAFGSAAGGRELYESLARDLEALTGYPHGQPQEILYPSNGRSQDWQVHEAGMVVIEPEIGSAADGFWPPPARIEPLASRLFPAILHIARVAGPNLVVRALAVEDPAGNRNGCADPGERCSLVLTLANQGLAPSPEAVLRVSAGTPALHLGMSGNRPWRGGSVVALRMPALAAGASCQLTADRVPIQIAADTEPGAALPFAIEIDGEGLGGALLAAEIRAGTPRRLLSAAETEVGWDFGQGWGFGHAARTPDAAQVERVSAGARSLLGGPRSAPQAVFTDSPAGPYPPSADRALTLRQPISLAGIAHAELRYREQFRVEPWEDRCLVEARSLDGEWEPLLVIPGGVETAFRERRLSLDRYAGEEAVWLRFRLVTNATVERDGWTVDGIEIWGYGGLPGATAIAEGPPAIPPPSATGSPSSAAE
jgi:hypothetical protein